MNKNKKRYLAHISIIIDDYDKAIHYYTQTLKFILKEDTLLNEEKRWVLIAPSADAETCLLLAKASNDRQMHSIGNQTGGRVFLFLYTDDFDGDYQNLLTHKIEIVREPVDEKWGRVLVFKDMYGNLWDLIEPIKYLI
jgi:catechol 2,3-dioxygenase-like lactoylglutathione lyase family enzyme